MQQKPRTDSPNSSSMPNLPTGQSRCHRIRSFSPLHIHSAGGTPAGTASGPAGRTFAADRAGSNLEVEAHRDSPEAEVRRSSLEVGAGHSLPGVVVSNSRREEGRMLPAAAAADSQGAERPTKPSDSQVWGGREEKHTYVFLRHDGSRLKVYGQRRDGRRRATSVRYGVLWRIWAVARSTVRSGFGEDENMSSGQTRVGRKRSVKNEIWTASGDLSCHRMGESVPISRHCGGADLEMSVRLASTYVPSWGPRSRSRPQPQPWPAPHGLLIALQLEPFYMSLPLGCGGVLCAMSSQHVPRLSGHCGLLLARRRNLEHHETFVPFCALPIQHLALGSRVPFRSATFPSSFAY